MEKEKFMFYRSFWDSIRQLPREVQGDVLTSIIEYGLNGETTEPLKPIASAILTLIKPIIDVNNKRFNNGLKGAEHGFKGGRPKKEDKKETPKKPQENPNETPNVKNETPIKEKEKEKEKDKEKELKKEKDKSFSKKSPQFQNFQNWIFENAPRVAQMKQPFSEDEYFSLIKDFPDKKFICDMIKAMHNYAPLLQKNVSANLTLRNWAKRETNSVKSGNYNGKNNQSALPTRKIANDGYEPITEGIMLECGNAE